VGRRCVRALARTDACTGAEEIDSEASLGAAVPHHAGAAATKEKQQEEHMSRIAIAFAALLATASIAAPQDASVVYTNIVDGQRVDHIVRAERARQLAAPIPPSIVTTPVLPRNYKTPLGARSYVPPVPSSMAAALPRPSKPVQPWFVNGVYLGPSPNGLWTSTSIGRPIVDVRIINDPTHGSRRTR
jgi:hypothetical protein